MLITMTEDTETKNEEQEEIENEGFEPGVKESPEVPVIQEQQFNVFPENKEEEKEEILLTASTVEKARAKMSSPSKAKSSRMRRRDEIRANVREQLEKQTTQIDKIRPMLQSILKDSKSIQGQSKLIKQLQLQLKQLQNQLTQIQKIITKKSFAIGTAPSRKKLINPKRFKKRR